jgi:AraC-like DNA-binding protein
MSKTINMADRLRQLLDLFITAEPGTDGTALAERAHFSRDHLDRLLAAATGEPPAALRRRLLLERAAWQLAHGATASEAARVAGYGSVAAFSRAFSRAHGASPSRHGSPFVIDAPNGIHFHPPAGLLIPGARAAARHGLSDRMLAHHLARCHELMQAAAALPAADLERPLRPGLVVVWFEGEEASAAEMLRRLVGTLEVWVAAIAGEPIPEFAGPLEPRLQRAGTALLRLVRSIRDRGAWDDAFIDALCEPPQSFTFGAVLSHILSFGAVRRETLAAVLTELGAQLSDGDPINWELRTRRSA